VALAACLALALARAAAAEEAKTEEAKTTPAAPTGVFAVVGAELKIWGSDSVALVTAPVSWDGTDWTRFGVFSAGVGALMLTDKSVYDYWEAHRTQSGADFADAIAPFGQQYATGLSVGLLVGGLVFSAPGTRDTGRDALEATVLSSVLVNVILKPAFGRVRPYDSNGETVFDPYSGNKSFPSGHATEAFAVASVIGMRSDGWVVPTIAYTTASLVAASRVVNSHHFTSDVLAGAVLGASIGRFIVRRHSPAPDAPPPAVRVTLVAIPHGLAVHASW
jgi:membrane-associated phospholipid phosphatase